MANVFSYDLDCVAVWRFESGALTTDSQRSNTLTDNNTVGTETSDYKEGSACADFELSNSEYFSITDTNLDSAFPMKSGDTNKKLSICGWFKPESLSGGAIGVFSKYDSGGDRRCFMLRIDGTDNFIMYIGYNGGASSEALVTAGTPATGHWYHVGFTFNDSDKSWQFVLWDDTAGSKVIDASGTAANNINISTAGFFIGGRDENGGVDYFFDGLIDEVVVFNDILTAAQIDEIRQGAYSEGPITCPPFEAVAALIATPEIQIPCEPFEADGVLSADVFAGAFVNCEPFIAAAGWVAPIIELQVNCPPFVVSASLIVTSEIQLTVPPFLATAVLVPPTIWDGSAWAAWIAANQSRITRHYYFTLTGDADATTDVTIPITSWQARRKSGAPTFLSVVIPWTAAYQAAIEARTHGVMQIQMAYLLDGVEQYREIICRADYETMRDDHGGRNHSLSLTGHKTETFTQKTIDLQDVIYVSNDNGDYRYRCASCDMYLNPGDTARYGSNEITVAQIVYMVAIEGAGTVTASMDVEEAAT